MTDEELIDVVKSGDKQAFREIIRTYESLIAATTISMLGKTPEAEDVGQEVFIRFYKNIESFRGDSSIGTYLTRIAMNLSLNEIKRRKRKKINYIDDDIKEVEDQRNDVKRFENKELVKMAMQQLDEKYRSIITLRLINGLSTRESAEILNVPEGTVLSRLARGQEKLKQIIEALS